VDKNKTAGIDVEDKQIKEKIYQQYVESFKKGVYNFIREDYDPGSQSIIPRKYFSGGMFGTELVLTTTGVSPLVQEATSSPTGEFDNVKVNLEPAESGDTTSSPVSIRDFNPFRLFGDPISPDIKRRNKNIADKLQKIVKKQLKGRRRDIRYQVLDASKSSVNSNVVAWIAVTRKRRD
jgi:hypothetical protein